MALTGCQLAVVFIAKYLNQAPNVLMYFSSCLAILVTNYLPNAQTLWSRTLLQNVRVNYLVQKLENFMETDGSSFSSQDSANCLPP
jgi:hypothetical protein